MRLNACRIKNWTNHDNLWLTRHTLDTLYKRRVPLDEIIRREVFIVHGLFSTKHRDHNVGVRADELSVFTCVLHTFALGCINHSEIITGKIDNLKILRGVVIMQQLKE